MGNKENIINKYSIEIQSIERIIMDLKNNNTWEYDQRRGVAKTSTLADRLEKEFNTLLVKIQNNDTGDSEKIYNALNKI